MEATLKHELLDERQAKINGRLAGALFIFLCIPLSLLGDIFVWAKIFVAKDPVATSANLLANEFIFRVEIVNHLAGTLIFVFMVVLLYRIFRPVDGHLARLMLLPVLAQIPVVFVMETLNYAALMVLKAEPRPTFDVAQQQEVSYFLLRLTLYNVGASKWVFGLLFFPWGMLILKSGFLPRIFGFIVIMAGIGYTADSCSYVLLERPIYLTIQPFLRFGATIGYTLTLLWMLVKGVKYPTGFS